MEYFKLIKEYLTPTVVAKMYLGEGNSKCGSIWYRSPFRAEKTASFCVNDKKGMHDFGDSKHYDVISFTKEFFNLKSMDAVRKLISDFGLPIEIESNKPKMFYERDLKNFREKLAKKRILEQAKIDFYNDLYSEACKEYRQVCNLIEDIRSAKSIMNECDLANIYTMRELKGWKCDYIMESNPEKVWMNKDFYINL